MRRLLPVLLLALGLPAALAQGIASCGGNSFTAADAGAADVAAPDTGPARDGGNPPGDAGPPPDDASKDSGPPGPGWCATQVPLLDAAALLCADFDEGSLGAFGPPNEGGGATIGLDGTVSTSPPASCLATVGALPDGGGAGASINTPFGGRPALVTCDFDLYLAALSTTHEQVGLFWFRLEGADAGNNGTSQVTFAVDSSGDFAITAFGPTSSQNTQLVLRFNAMPRTWEHYQLVLSPGGSPSVTVSGKVNGTPVAPQTVPLTVPLQTGGTLGIGLGLTDYGNHGSTGWQVNFDNVLCR